MMVTKIVWFVLRVDYSTFMIHMVFLFVKCIVVAQILISIDIVDFLTATGNAVFSGHNTRGLQY